MGPSVPVTTAPNNVSSARADPNRLVAERDAGAVVARYAPPAGSVRLPSAPHGSGLAVAPSRPGTPDLIDRTRFWRTSGDMASVMAWVLAHAPAHATLVGTGSYGTDTEHQASGELGPSPPEFKALTTDAVFSLPAPRPVFSSRQELVTVAMVGRDVVLRIDAQDVWYPTRPAWSYLVSADTVATVTVWSGPGGGEPRTVEVHGVVAAHLRHLVNAMPVGTGGVFSCPAESGDHVLVRFSGPHAGPVSLSALIPECGGFEIREPGHPMIELDDTDGLLVAAEALAAPGGSVTPASDPS